MGYTNISRMNEHSLLWYITFCLVKMHENSMKMTLNSQGYYKICGMDEYFIELIMGQTYTTIYNRTN